MKKLVWFKTGDNIPNDAKYIKSDRIAVGTKTELVEDWPPYGGGGNHEETVTVYTEMHLYEISCE